MANLLTSLFQSNKPQTKTSVFREAGVSGVSLVSGFLLDREKNPNLSGMRRFVTFEDIAQNIAIVAASVRLRSNLVAKAIWSVEMVDESLPGSEEAKEFGERLMDDHNGSWSKFIRQSAMFRFYGSSISEWTARKAEDGTILLDSVENRPMRTISRWDMDDRGTVNGFWQRGNDFSTELYLPRWKTVYLNDDTVSDSPEGSGLIRHVVESVNRLKNYLSLETTGYERDLRGSPIGKAPIDAINRAIEADEITKEQGDAALQGIIDLVTAQRKGESTGAIIDSSVYTGTGTSGDGKQISSVPQWGIELLKGGSDGLADMAKAIERLNHEIARTLGTEGLMLGGSIGSQALSNDKTTTLHDQVNADLGDIAQAYTTDLLEPFCKLNGIDPSLIRFKVEQISGRDATEATAAIKDMVAAGAHFLPSDILWNELRTDLGYSPQEESDLAIIEAKELEDQQRQTDEFNSTMAELTGNKTEVDPNANLDN